MINIAVESASDVEAARAVLRAASQEVGSVRVARGKYILDDRVRKYAHASAQAPWVIFRDADGECPVELRARLLDGVTAARHRFEVRVACSMTEAWLLADREAVARYFSIAPARVTLAPDQLPHAKRSLLELCRRSTSRSVREDMWAGEGEAGPLYVDRLNEFAAVEWSVERAGENSPSLRRAVRRISAMDRA